ncbi:hypothetical protein BRADO3279 [Bradyrhizobium sp. ORS 278]|nr:hypothetical protein BRADO3279 [Bradyrhizobium sp. ORS 278]
MKVRVKVFVENIQHQDVPGTDQFATILMKPGLWLLRRRRRHKQELVEVDALRAPLDHDHQPRRDRRVRDGEGVLPRLHAGACRRLNTNPREGPPRDCRRYGVDQAGPAMQAALTGGRRVRSGS